MSPWYYGFLDQLVSGQETYRLEKLSIRYAFQKTLYLILHLATWIQYIPSDAVSPKFIFMFMLSCHLQLDLSTNMKIQELYVIGSKTRHFEAKYNIRKNSFINKIKKIYNYN